MTRKNFMITTAILSLSMTSAALASPEADLNQDGQVTRAEFDAASDARFAKADLNLDGYISVEEREQARDAHMAERQTAHFDRLDSNGDGILTREEFSQSVAAHHEERRDRMQEKRDEMRAKIDTDGDGQISETEKTAARDAFRGQRNAFMERRRGGERQGMRHDRGENRWQKIDLNGDSLISAQEYKAGADKMFEMLDADGNGVLTQGEGRKRPMKRRR